MPFQIEHQIDLPTGTLLRAKLTNMEVREVPKRDGGTFQRLKWTFEITQQGDYFGKTVAADNSNFWSDSTYGSGAQNRAWAEALLGRPLQAGQMVSESDLIGLPCEITVKYEDDRKDATKKWPRVEDVFSLQDDGFGDQPPF